MIVAAMLLVAAADCRDPVTQTAMTMCAKADYDHADAAMTAQWKRTLASMRAKDLAIQDPRSTPPSYADALLQSQRAWIAFRDAQCRIEGYRMRGGSAEPMVVWQCKAELTRARSRDLRELTEGY